MQTILRSLSAQRQDKKAIEHRTNESSTVPQIKRTKVDLVSDDEGQDARDEVDLQGGAPLREEEGGGGENQVWKDI